MVGTAGRGENRKVDKQYTPRRAEYFTGDKGHQSPQKHKRMGYDLAPIGSLAIHTDAFCFFNNSRVAEGGRAVSDELTLRF